MKVVKCCDMVMERLSKRLYHHCTCHCLEWGSFGEGWCTGR